MTLYTVLFYCTHSSIRCTDCKVDSKLASFQIVDGILKDTDGRIVDSSTLVFPTNWRRFAKNWVRFSYVSFHLHCFSIWCGWRAISWWWCFALHPLKKGNWLCVGFRHFTCWIKRNKTMMIGQISLQLLPLRSWWASNWLVFNHISIFFIWSSLTDDTDSSFCLMNSGVTSCAVLQMSLMVSELHTEYLSPNLRQSLLAFFTLLSSSIELLLLLVDGVAWLGFFGTQ